MSLHGETSGKGVVLGVDVGSVRVGVAVSDPDRLMATPLTTVQRHHRGRDIAQLARLVRERSVTEVVIGIPLSLRGEEGASARMARQYAKRLKRAIHPVPVQEIDERMTTVIAHRVLREGTTPQGRRRSVVDQIAAVEILQSWLDMQRRSVEE